jgi:dTDP-L-rhamnose 4-epimerase
MALLIGRAYQIPVAALRFFNVYGPRQALSNPYTGVLAIFAARLLNRNAPLIFEDGLQRRDFVSVHDVARACVAALEAPSQVAGAFNIGSGRSFTIREIAERLAQALDRRSIAPEIAGRYRMGDIRHCFADIARARRDLGYEPRVTFDEGIQELAAWLEGRTADDRVTEARSELQRRGLAL